MNKSVRIGSVLLSMLLAFPVVGITGCKKEGTLNPEEDAVVFSTEALDGNFNPFFATSLTDSNIASITQIGMLSTDANGNPLCGEDEPTVARSYTQKMLTGTWNSQTCTVDNAVETTDGEKADYTQYEFVIKNGIKFSDGEPLTIKDVLFNLYVYLDPAYMGSATIYSTDIVGLNKYRTQNPLATDDSGEASMTSFYVKAEERIQAIKDYIEEDSGIKDDKIEADIQTVRKLFREEVESDWTAYETANMEDYQDEYRFTEAWELFYFNEGIVSVQVDAAGKPKKDEQGKYLTSLDDPTNELAETIAAELTQENINAKKAEYGCDDELAKNYIIRDYAIDVVYDTYCPADNFDYIPTILDWWATGGEAREDFAAEAKSDYYDSLKNNDGTLRVKTIEGIQPGQKTIDGKNYDTLTITINKVDPKAIYNFAFAVTPMHYYSSKELSDAADGVTNFGVSFADKDFFDNELKKPEKNAKPVGAGTYKATDEKGSDDPAYGWFSRNNWVYFKRNEYFHTVGEGIENAKIKYLRYKVVGSDKILNALATGEIHFGEPNATQDNINKIAQYDHLKYKQYQTNGYGYVGINPKHVPDIEVRQAIMKSMNTASIILDYYTETLADVIYRPMSITNWAYPKDENGDLIGEYDKVAYTNDKAAIKALVESADWELNNSGVYEKDGQQLEITFTIAGSTTDHPAYSMFEKSAALLRECGFIINVTTDVTALKSLATGGLQVWAAAWSSTIDPDMYQVYHKDSTATSVQNWGYPTILTDTSGQYDYEKGIIEELSELIERGRQTINEDDRKVIYAQALDKVMELCVELPTYQRNDLVVYNSDYIDVSTLNSNPTANTGVVDKLWELNYIGGGVFSGNGGSNVGLIVGIIIGAVVLLGGGAALAFILIKKNKKPKVIVLGQAVAPVEETAEPFAEMNEANEEPAEKAKPAEETVVPAEETQTENQESPSEE